MEFKIPETTTLIRWALRALLVVFLTWLFQKHREPPEEEDEDEQTASDDKDWRQQKPRNGRANSDQWRSRNDRSAVPRDPPYPRQRLPNPRHGTENGGGFAPPPQRRSWPVEGSGIANGSGGETPDAKIAAKWKDALLEKTSPAPYEALSPTPAAERPRLNLKKKAVSGDKTKVEDKVLKAHTRPVTHLIFNSDGTLLFTCGKDKLIFAWTIPEGSCLGQFSGHRGAVNSCSVTTNSKWLVTCGADSRVVVWEARTQLKLVEAELPGVARAVEWSKGAAGEDAESELFAVCHNKFASKPAAVAIMRFDGKDAIQELAIEHPVLPTPAVCLAWGRDNATLASGHDDGTICFWSTSLGTLLERLNAHEGAVSQMQFPYDHGLMATCSQNDMELRLWDVSDIEGSSASTGSRGTLLRRTKSDRPLNCVAIRPSLSREELLRSEEEAPCQVIAGGGQDARDVALVGSGKNSGMFETLLFRCVPQVVADGASDTTNTILPYPPEECVKGHFGPIHTLAFTPDGCLFASGSEDGCVRLHKLLPPSAQDGGATSGAESGACTPGSSKSGAKD